MTTTLESLAAKWEAEAASSASIPTECTDDGAMYRACLEAKSETLTACAAELRAALAEGGWQTMESAPKSRVEEGGRIVGEYILGFCPDESWLDPKSCICVIWWEPLTDGGVWYGEGGFAVRPTHWQPLPEPPR